MRRVEQEIEKIKKTLNLQSDSYPIYGMNPELNKLTFDTHLKSENERVNEELHSRIKKLEMEFSGELKRVCSANWDEVSLLNEVTGRLVQGIPQYNIT